MEGATWKTRSSTPRKQGEATVGSVRRGMASAMATPYTKVNQSPGQWARRNVMGFWGAAKKGASLSQLNDQLRKAIMNDDAEEEARIRAEIAKLKKDKSSKKEDKGEDKKPMAKKKSMVG